MREDNLVVVSLSISSGVFFHQKNPFLALDDKVLVVIDTVLLRRNSSKSVLAAPKEKAGGEMRPEDVLL